VISISVCSGCQHPQVAVHSSAFPASGDVPITTPFVLASICSLQAEVWQKAPVGGLRGVKGAFHCRLVLLC